LDVLDAAEDGRIAFRDLPSAIEAELSTNQLAKLGSLGWHVTTVKLEMEVAGEIARVPGAKPQQLQRL
jgi:hypothetical protein